MAVYRYIFDSNDQYTVEKRWIDKQGKEHYTEYLVSFKNGGMNCSCKGWMRYRKKCKHIKGILSQLADKGGIIQFRDEKYEFDWNSWFGKKR